MPDVKDTLLNSLTEANKRACSIYAAAERLSGKLHGPRPSETANALHDDSVMGLVARLNGTLMEIGAELDRQHNTIGENAPEKPQSARAVGY